MRDTLPTKGNLQRSQHLLSLARQGFLLLDRKMTVLERKTAAARTRWQADAQATATAFHAAHKALSLAKMEMGSHHLYQAAEKTFSHPHRIPFPYPLAGTTLSLDKALRAFQEAANALQALAESENNFRQLHATLVRTKKRANALQHVLVPQYEGRIRYIQAQLATHAQDEMVRVRIAKNIDRKHSAGN